MELRGAIAACKSSPRRGNGALQPMAKKEDARVKHFVELLSGAQRAVFLYAMSLLYNASDAEEVLQETNLVLWQKFDDYQPGTDFVRWASRIAYYEVLKLRERRSREERLFSSEFLEMMAREVPTRLDLSEDRRQALRSCLDKLRDQDRHLVLLRYQPGSTTRRVAETLGRSVQGARKSLQRIRGTLFSCVQRTLSAEGRL